MVREWESAIVRWCDERHCVANVWRFGTKNELRKGIEASGEGKHECNDFRAKNGAKVSKQWGF